MQDRLVKAMRLEGVSTIAQANAFLPAYMARHNRQFARTPFDPRDLHRPLAPHENIEAEMVWREQRTVTAALTLHYNNLWTPPAARLIFRHRQWMRKSMRPVRGRLPWP
ncbi:hypothetical protein [Sphingomonas hominis]|uniref:hypothetical protein n=1 Tax=Sphingomonas hominis TaxID=2741495 RepID=UPI001FE71605|nr:hypothetical protein [Sphingomonas hominis]